jgi:hypothetical protein
VPAGKAEDEWGYYSTRGAEGGHQGDARMEQVGEDPPGLEVGDTLLVVEIPPLRRRGTMAVIGLGFVGNGWRVREKQNDLSGRMIAG